MGVGHWLGWASHWRECVWPTDSGGHKTLDCVVGGALVPIAEENAAEQEEAEAGGQEDEHIGEHA